MVPPKIGVGTCGFDELGGCFCEGGLEEEEEEKEEEEEDGERKKSRKGERVRR
jgi:hypothetical protein